MEQNDFNDASSLPNMGGFMATSSNFGGIHVEEERDSELAGSLNEMQSSNDWIIHSALALMHVQRREDKRTEQRNRILEQLMSGQAESVRDNETNSMLNAVKLYTLKKDMSKMNWLDTSTISNPTPASSPNVKISLIQKKTTLANKALSGQETSGMFTQMQNTPSSVSNTTFKPSLSIATQSVEINKEQESTQKDVPDKRDKVPNGQETKGLGNGMRKIDLLDSSPLSRQYITPESLLNRKLLERIKGLKRKNVAIRKSDMSNEQETNVLGTQMQTIDKSQAASLPFKMAYRTSSPQQPKLFNYGVKKIKTSLERDHVQNSKEKDIITEKDKAFTEDNRNKLGTNMETTNVLKDSSLSNTASTSSSYPQLFNRRVQKIRENLNQPDIFIDKHKVLNEQKATRLDKEMPNMEQMHASSFPKPIPTSSQKAALEERRHIDKADGSGKNNEPEVDSLAKFGSKEYIHHVLSKLVKELKEIQKRCPNATGEIDRKQLNAHPASSSSNLDDVKSPNLFKDRKEDIAKNVGICHNQGVIKKSKRLMEQRTLLVIVASKAIAKEFAAEFPAPAEYENQLDKVPMKNKVSGIELLNKASSNIAPSTSKESQDSKPSTSKENLQKADMSAQHKKVVPTPTNTHSEKRSYDYFRRCFLFMKTKKKILDGLRLRQQKLNTVDHCTCSPDWHYRYQKRLTHRIKMQEQILKELAEPLSRKVLRATRIEFLRKAIEKTPCEAKERTVREDEENSLRETNEQSE